MRVGVEGLGFRKEPLALAALHKQANVRGRGAQQRTPNPKMGG